MSLRSKMLFSVCALVLFAWSGAAIAQEAVDTPGLAVLTVGHAKARLTITAGESGAPYGFTVWWMRADRFEELGGQWPSTPTADVGVANFTGAATLNTWGAGPRSFQLGSGEGLDVEIGDLFDETGVTGNLGELAHSTDYVFTVFANGYGEEAASGLATTEGGATSTLGANCTFTLGYWKNHPGVWPVTSLTLGTVNYTAAQLMSILTKPVRGNGLISLAHQLITAKLNIANGANSASIAGTIAAADAQIGGLVVPPVGAGALDPSTTSAKTQLLDDFNNGVTGPGHCGATPTHKTTWGEVKTRYR